MCGFSWFSGFGWWDLLGDWDWAWDWELKISSSRSEMVGGSGLGGGWLWCRFWCGVVRVRCGAEVAGEPRLNELCLGCL